MLGGLRSDLFAFIHESMQKKVLKSIPSKLVEFEGVTDMYNWVSST